MDMYNIWLVNTISAQSRVLAVPGQGDRDAIAFGVQNGFIPIVQKANPAFGGANVRWLVCPITQLIQPHELIVYFVVRRSDTVLRTIEGATASVDAGGYTVSLKNGLRASEMYADAGSSDLLARLTLHELMHNKLMLGDNMHDPAVGGGGIAKQSIGVTDDLTQKNIDLMGQHLRDRIPQWAGGCDSNFDPLRGLLN